MFVLRSHLPPIKVTLICLGVLFAVSIVSALFTLGSIPLAVTVFGLYGVYIVYATKNRNHLLWLLLVYGLVTGFTEVVSDCDHFLVEEQQVLVYPSDIPKIGVSPAYLPVAWGLVFTMLTIIGEWFRRKHSMLKASLLTAVLGAVLIAVFENLARPAGWWYYQNTPMLVYAPYFVNVFEFLSTAVFVLAAFAMERKSLTWAYGWAILAGVLTGLWMCVAMRIAFWLLGPCEGAVIQLPCHPVPVPEFFLTP